MRIALLNLPFDNNYGGNLQRFALMVVLQNMGHDVTHIFLRIHYKLPWYKALKELPLRIIKKCILGRGLDVFWEWKYNVLDNELADTALPFYEKYIKHTAQIIDVKGIKSVCSDDYDVYLVGSDQVWREDMTRQIGIENYFFDFIREKQDVKKIAYAVSLGSDHNMFSQKKMPKLTNLYKKFDAVSYREKSSMRIFEEIGWIQPYPHFVLDPTLLLDVNNYEQLIAENETQALTKGLGYCYVLDQSKTVLDTIDKIASKTRKNVIVDGINNIQSSTSIPQWLRNIHDAEFVITDSYHGTVFSILFKKPFVFLGNERRGNTRIESLFSALDIVENGLDFIECNESVYSNLLLFRKESYSFLQKHI